MSSRVLSVRLIGDARDLERTLNGAADGTEKAGKRFLSMGKAAAIGAGAAGLGLVVAGLKSSVAAAQESEKAQARLESALEGANLSYSKHGKAIDAAIQKTSRLAAIDDEELSDAFSKLVRTTENVTEATEGMNLAADIARARNISLETAVKAVEKAHLGSDAALKKFGIRVPQVNDATEQARASVERLKEAHDGKLTPALEAQAKQMMKNAAALDKQATAEDALRAAQEKFAGSAAKYGETSAAAQERLGIAIENVQEKIGAKLLPILARMAEAAVQAIDWMEANWPRFSKAVEDVYQRVKPAVDAIRTIVGNTVDAIRGYVDIVVGIFTGDWSRAWDGMRRVVTNALENAKAILKLEGVVWKAILGKLGDLAVDGLRAALVGLGEVARAAVTKLPGIVLEVNQRAYAAAFELAGRIARGLLDALSTLPGKVSTLLGQLPGVIRGWAEAVGSAGLAVGRALFGKLVDGLAGIGDALYAKIRAAVNYVVGKANSIISRINKALQITTPSLEIMGKTVVPSITYDPPDIPDIPYLAKGGVVTEPTLAMIGESGAEAVVPLDRAGRMLGGDLTVVVPLEVDGVELARVVRKYALRDAATLVPSGVTGDGAYGLS